MSIASYLAYPAEGRREQLLHDLSMHPNCEVVLAENSDVFILVTDTPTREEERATEQFLRDHEGLLCLAMVYGQLEEEAETEKGIEAEAETEADMKAEANEVNEATQEFRDAGNSVWARSEER